MIMDLQNSTATETSNCSTNDFKLFPDLYDDTIHSNIKRATNYSTRYFKTQLQSVLEECTSRKDPVCGKITSVTSKLTSVLPYFGRSLSAALEEGGKFHRVKISRKISKRIKFQEGSETECLVSVAKAFAKLNIAFYNALYSPSEYAVSESSLSCIASDMVHRLFHYIKNLDTNQVYTVTEDFIIHAVLHGKSNNNSQSEVKAKFNPSTKIDRVDGKGKHFISQILNSPHHFEPTLNSSDQSMPSRRLPFRFEDIGKGQDEIDAFWTECDSWVHTLAADVVLNFSSIYNYLAPSLSHASSLASSLASSVSGTPHNRSPRASGCGSFQLGTCKSQCFEFNVSSPVFNFCGREKELSILKNVVNFERDKDCAYLLTGCRGMGKSELVRAFAFTTFNKAGNVIWLQGESCQTFMESLKSLGYKLQLDEFVTSNSGNDSADSEIVEWSSLVLNKFLHRVIRKLDEFYSPISLFVVDNLETRFDLFDSTLLFLKKECKTNVFTLITSSYQFIVGCERLLLSGLEAVDTERLVSSELQRFNASRNPLLVKCILLLCNNGFQNHPLGIRQVLNYLEKILLLNFTNNLQTFVQNVLESGGGLIAEKDREKDILSHKLDPLTYNYSHTLANLWELKTLELQSIDASVLESNVVRTGPLTDKFLKYAAYLSVILNSDAINLKFLKLVLNLSDEMLSKVLYLLNDHCLLLLVHQTRIDGEKEICVQNIFVRIIYVMANQYETAGVLGVLLNAIKNSVDSLTAMDDVSNDCQLEVKIKNAFLSEFVRYADAIFSFATKIPELLDLLAECVSSFLYALRNYDMHQPLVQKYQAFFADNNNRLNPNYDSRLWAFRLEEAYVKINQGDYDEAEWVILTIIKTTADASFSPDNLPDHSAYPRTVYGPPDCFGYGYPPVPQPAVVSQSPVISRRDCGEENGLVQLHPPPIPPRLSKNTKGRISTRVNKLFRSREALNTLTRVQSSEMEEQIENKNRNIRKLKFRALLDLVLVFYKQGNKSKAIETTDVILGNLAEEMSLDHSNNASWVKLRAVALHYKNLMEIDKRPN